MNESKFQTKDSKYIQQHLANERTYLAWIRTSVTIVALGFLITNLHFSTLSAVVFISDLLARIIGLASIAVGITLLITATISYFTKGNDINQQTFRFSRIRVMFLSVSLILIFLVFAAYYLFVWKLI